VRIKKGAASAPTANAPSSSLSTFTTQQFIAMTSNIAVWSPGSRQIHRRARKCPQLAIVNKSEESVIHNGRSQKDENWPVARKHLHQLVRGDYTIMTDTNAALMAMSGPNVNISKSYLRDAAFRLYIHTRPLNKVNTKWT